MRDNRRPTPPPPLRRPPDPSLVARLDATMPLIVQMVQHLSEEQVAELTDAARRMLEHPKYRERDQPAPD